MFSGLANGPPWFQLADEASIGVTHEVDTLTGTEARTHHSCAQLPIRNDSTYILFSYLGEITMQIGYVATFLIPSPGQILNTCFLVDTCSTPACPNSLGYNYLLNAPAGRLLLEGLPVYKLLNKTGVAIQSLQFGSGSWTLTDIFGGTYPTFWNGYADFQFVDTSVYPFYFGMQLQYVYEK